MALFHQKEGMIMKKLSMIFFLFGVSLAFADSDEEIFLRGNQLYNQEKYADALSSYQRINKKNNAVWYNMGNSFYMLHDYYNAYAYWCKAAQSCSTAQYKMAMANIATVEQKLNKTLTFNRRAWRLIDGWQPLVVQLIFLFFWCILFWRAAYWYRQRRTIALIVLIGCVGLSALAVAGKYYVMRQQRALVIHDQAPVFIGPRNDYQQVGALEKGTEVKVVERREQWVKIKNKQLKGWIAQENILEL